MNASIKRTVDEYGFDNLDVRTSEGGHKTISYYGAGTVDIGTVSSVNPHGLGNSDYIRKADDVQRHIANVAKTVWLSDEERAHCILFLQEIKDKAEAFLKVKERFDVKSTYAPNSRRSFTFTEKAPAITMHTTISITIEQPTEGGWNEGTAWRALYDALDASRERRF